MKVLDFGLAKALEAAKGGPIISSSPTMMASMPGMLLGTLAYMAPEQARGTPVDKRADIWAFGVVFYEMLTGRRAFDGEDVSSILAAVLQSEPRWDGVPPNLRRVLESCLEKDPRNRLRDIGDVWRLVDDAPTPAASSLRPTRMGWMVAAALAGVAAIALWAPWRKAPIYVAPLPLRLDVDFSGWTYLSSRSSVRRSGPSSSRPTGLGWYSWAASHALRRGCSSAGWTIGR